MTISARQHQRAAARVARLVERAMTFAVEEYDDDAAVGRLAWLAQGDHTALDEACDVCLSYTEIDLAVRGRAIGLLARVRYGDLPASSAASPATAWGAVKRGQEQHDQDDSTQREQW